MGGVVVPVVFYLLADFFCFFFPELIGNKAYCHVGACGDTGGGIDIAVTDPAGFSFPEDACPLVPDPVKGILIGRRVAAVQNACRRQKSRACADGEHPFRLRGKIAEAGEEPVVGDKGSCSHAARDDEDI